MQQRAIIRNVLNGIGIIGIMVFLLGCPGSYYLLIGSVIIFFLGLTDFGRQCPLILSVRHLLYRIRLKKQSRIL